MLISYLGSKVSDQLWAVVKFGGNQKSYSNFQMNEGRRLAPQLPVFLKSDCIAVFVTTIA